LVAALVFGGAAGASSSPRFVVLTASGKSASFSYTGYTFGTTTPPLGKPGTIQVDVTNVTSEAVLKKTLPVGARLSSARLDISAVLPHPQHFSYLFAGAKVSALSIFSTPLGLRAAITLSFTKLSRS
jgi:hypothetical protein